MTQLALLVAELENGSTDLMSCLSSRPDLSRDEQFQLTLADQRFRIGRGEPCSLEHYVQLLSWLASDASRQQQLIACELKLRLGSDSSDALLAQFESRYGHLGEPLLKILRQQFQQWNTQRLEDTRFDQICYQFENQIQSGIFPSIESYLRRAPAASLPELFRELLSIEIRHRQRLGHRIDWRDYEHRFREHITSIDAAKELYITDSISVKRSWESTETFSFPNPIRSDLTGSFISRLRIGDLRNGRYRLERRLGQGAYGEVYLARDNDLKRQVAVKVPSREALAKLVDVDSYMVEAQNTAVLDHPNIVSVYDVDRTLDGQVYVVLKFIDGYSLTDWIRKNPFDFPAIAKLLVPLAEALHHAHQRRLIHRDIKPANILIEESTGTPYIADFGLAIREEDYPQDGRIAGTPAYMSPEQLRGEGHRLDGRSDLFSLGVVMYLMLTGHLPFPGQTLAEVAQKITSIEPTAPRSLNSDIPPELERICSKLLRKRFSERYANGAELAEDLRAWLSPRATQSAIKAPQKITWRGLRSFTAEDAAFFLDLLPGPRNRNGLPESIAFWKHRIEQRDPDHTFTVGLIYGPSGCGKSSLVKAGLIPNLSSDVIAIYVEATTEETEQRMVRGLRKAIPELPQDSELVDALKFLRRSDFKKVVFIIDQFEQWLVVHSHYDNTELTNALRQCDGDHVQGIVMIRDDFAMAAARWMNALDVPILQGVNFATVDLFDSDHARSVLIQFGRAFEKLSSEPPDSHSEQYRFIDQVVSALAENGKVISMQIALFAEMVKDKPWVPSTLREVGGTEGIGVSFLEETFNARSANPQHKVHQQAARQLLAALLPEVASDIKGHMRSHDALLQESIYKDRPDDFRELIWILDGQLRLITPTDPEGVISQNSSSGTSPANRFYQLTHDYLVPSLREWLTRKQRETKKGRAELKLAERAAVWGANQENKQLPTLVEWLQIRFWTERNRWKTPERSLMRTAARVHARNWGSSILLIALLSGIIGYMFHQQNTRSQQEKIAVTLDTLRKTLGPSVRVNIEKLLDMKRPDLIRPELLRQYGDARESKEKLSFAFGLASFGQVEVDYLISQIDNIEYRDTANLIAALRNDRLRSIEKLKQAASECQSEDLWKRKARLALLALSNSDTTLPTDTCEFEGRTDHGLRTWFIDEFPSWKLNLGNVIDTVANTDSPALRSAICLGIGRIAVTSVSAEDKDRIVRVATSWFSTPDSSTHSAVVWLMREWGIPEPKVEDVGEIVPRRNWFVNSQGVPFAQINPKPIKPKPPDPLKSYRQELSEIDSMPPGQRSEIEQYYRQRKISLLYQTGQYEEALLLLEDFLTKSNSDDLKTLRLLCLSRLKRTQEAEFEMAKWTARTANSPPRDADYVESLVQLWLGRKAEAIERLAEGWAKAEFADQQTLFNIARATALFASSESATDDEKRQWNDRALSLLERWSQGQGTNLRAIRDEPDFLVLQVEPRFLKLVAEPSNVPEQPYWLANREVTRGEFEEFLRDETYTGTKPPRLQDLNTNRKYHPTNDHPAHSISWFDALMYCNWLSIREGRRPGYRVIGREKRKRGNQSEVEWDIWEFDESAGGYRLPKEIEWEYACRAGSETMWSSGSSELQLEAYCQMMPSGTASVCGKKLPNAWGFHDMHGNVKEWCWDSSEDHFFRRLRGGSFVDSAVSCTSDTKAEDQPPMRSDNFGLRLALSSPKPPKASQRE